VSRFFLVLGLAWSVASNVVGAVPRGCAGSAPLGSFHLTVAPPLKDAAPAKGAALPVKSVDAIPAGSRLIWDPVHLPPQSANSAEISAALLPAPKGDLILVEPRKAGKRQEWVIAKSPGVVALIYGPQGLSAGKIRKLVARNEDLLNELATYAEQTSEVEALVQELADSEDAGVSADAALKGFGSRYGVAVPKLSASATTNQQAGVLLTTLMPTANAYDPLGSAASQTQASAGLAASVAGMFFGSNVGLAAGGVALFADLKTMAFPGSEFRSAFAQASSGDALTLCTKSAAPKARTHVVYLWAYRVPNDKPPVVTLAGGHIPVASKSEVKVSGAAAAVKELARAREWKLLPTTLVPATKLAPATLTPATKGDAVPVTVTVPATPADAIELDLSKSKLAPGDYRLQALWDWTKLDLGGTLHVHAYGDFSHLAIASESRDKLIAGSGAVPIVVTGADFEFVEKAALLPKPESNTASKAESKSTAKAAPRDLTFQLPEGKRAGEQRSIEVNVDTDQAGSYLLALTQSDGVKHETPVTILPPNPKISDLPLRVNLGESSRPIHLAGSGLDRIESISTAAGEFTGAAKNGEWVGTFRMKDGLTAGKRFALSVKVAGLDAPLTLDDAVEVVGPRPKIVSVRASMPGNLGTEIHEGELPSGAVVGLALRVEHLYGASGQPAISIACSTGDLRGALKLAPDQAAGGASLTQAGPGNLYLSFDPGKVGYPGCALTARVTTEPEGSSDAQPLGRVIRLPRVEQLTLTNEKAAPGEYVGALKGSDLDIVEKVGWDAQNGVPIDSIPTPVPGDPAKETLKIALPWPAPEPHAPLYVWLRDEHVGRQTSVTY
jgi:hypothetical protein